MAPPPTRRCASRAFASLLASLSLACASEIAPAPAPPSPAATPAPPAPAPAWGGRAISDSGRLRGRLDPESGAVELGHFQSWIVELRDASGAPVIGAQIAIAGGMPAHGHGLPSQPRVTEELGDGRYRIEGVKLNMVGAWVIEVFVQTATARDRLRFDLAIDY